MGGILKRTSLDKVPDISDDVQSMLEGVGITTAELLAHSNSGEISSAIGIPKDKALAYIRHARQTIGFKSIMTGFEKEKERISLLETGFDCIDKALDGGVKSGSIIELQGQQWAGKTLMCAHLAIQAQMVKTDNDSVPKVIWYDSDRSFRKKRIKEIAYRYRMDPEIALRDIILVDVKKKGFMEPSLETMRKTLAKHHVSLVIIDSLSGSLRYLKPRSTHSHYIASISQLIQTTGAVVAFTNRTQIGFSRSMLREHKRSGSLPMMIDYGFNFHPNGENERSVETLGTKCNLYIGPGGFFEDYTSRNLEKRRVQRGVF